MKKIFSMLALLLMAVTGAVAQTETLLITINSTSSFTSGSRTFNNIATVTFSSGVECDDDDDGWYNTGGSNKILSVTPAAGYTITKVKFYCGSGSAFDETSPFEATLYGNLMYVNGSSYGASGVNKIEVYGYAAPATVAVTGVTLDKTSAEMTVGGDALTLTATVAPENATDQTVTWTTSDASVATVANGVVTAKAAGTATITATATNGTADTSDDKTATCTVTVTEPSPALADGSYYVKNGALSLYMAAGGSWGTQGIVNERGLDLIFTYNSGTKTYTIDSNLDNGSNHFLNSGLYMDAPSFGWTVEGENSFTISANLDGVKKYLAVDQNNNLVYTEDGTAENAQWIIIPKADNENAVLAAGLDALKAATAENGVDATFLIACPGFNRNDKRNAEAWTVEGNNLKMGGGSSDGNGCAECYNSTFTLSQTLSNAPAGVYTLTAQGFYKQNGSDNENLPYFYANDEKQTFKLLEDQIYSMTEAGPLFTQGKYTIDPITVVVAEDGALTIGAKLETNTQLWSCWDNFKLTYYGPQSEKPEDMYDLKLADGSEAHGTVAFTVDGVATEKAKKDDVVTVSVTPNEGYSAKDVTVRAYTGWESAGARRMNRAGENPEMIKDITVTPGENNTWTFTMPESDVTVEVTYAVVDKSALNTAITEAETYYNSIKDDHAEAAAALKTVIDNAKTMQEKGDATQEEVNNALSALNTAKTTAEGAVLTETKTALNNDITAAETYYNSIKDSNPTAAATLLDAINAANTVKGNTGATQEQVDAAIAALASAKTTAEQTVLTETKNALNNAITEAEAYYSNISESNLKATDLLTAINAAKAVKNNASATQTQIETAAETLTDALNAAKADDALKRIAVTIPAKSYVTRIDADKRQIETAVEGVSLYTVTGVTDKQVTLSAALNVVAAKMPYLIYNDNDEEKTINLIVSSEDADNVTVAAEFKGTLVDKTFTDEDMGLADHYVLSNGHNFVWVKDAGTLAGGKCWIELTKAAGARRLSIVAGGEATGIDLAPVLTEGEDAWYDLNGRRVVKPTKKGLYIMNGKKYVVK